MIVCKFNKIWQMCYGVIFVYDFVNYRGWIMFCKMVDVVVCFGMFCLYQNVIFMCVQWEYMVWSCDIGGFVLFVDCGCDG